MPRLFANNTQLKTQAVESNAQIFITGGHGGLVTYDGAGGRMIKEGGPMDRLFLLINDGRMLGDAGLDIDYGYINFHTGPLASDVVLVNSVENDSTIHFTFKANLDENAMEVRGGIRQLGIERDSLLVGGTVAESYMVWETGDKSKKDASLPYVAHHPKVTIHPKILDWFGIGSAVASAGVTGWCKLTPKSMNVKDSGKHGAAFRTQQHLGHLSVFLKLA